MKDNFGNELDEMKFGTTTFENKVEENTYLLKAKHGRLFGYADIKDGVCVKWETYGLQFNWEISVLRNGVYSPLNKANKRHQKGIDKTVSDFCNYIELKLTKGVAA